MSTRLIKYLSRSSAETRKIGQKIGVLLGPGMVVALIGELGAGKTTFVKGIAKGLGVPKGQEVLSPSFVLIHEYQGREKVYHLDWYRLKDIEGADRQFAEECFHSKGITLVEWAQRGKGILPDERIEIRLEHKGPGSRSIAVAAKGKNNLVFMEALSKK